MFTQSSLGVRELYKGHLTVQTLHSLQGVWCCANIAQGIYPGLGGPGGVAGPSRKRSMEHPRVRV